jgi:hypothetical protein
VHFGKPTKRSALSGHTLQMYCKNKMRLLHRHSVSVVDYMYLTMTSSRSKTLQVLTLPTYPYSTSQWTLRYRYHSSIRQSLLRIVFAKRQQTGDLENTTKTQTIVLYLGPLTHPFI